MPGFAGDVDDCLGAHPAVKVFVQGDFRGRRDLLGGGGFAARHEDISNVTVSATHAGLSLPLISTVCRSTTRWPLSMSSTSQLATRTRSLALTLTGAINRSIFKP